MKASINEIGTDENDIDEDMESGLIPSEISPDVVSTYQLSKSVKTFALIDFILNVPYSFISLWYILPLCISVGGYIGAKNYNKCLVYVYLLFQVFSILGRLSLTLFYYNRSDDTDFITFLYIINILLTIFLTFLDAYIARFTVKLIQYIRRLQPEELQQLQEKKLIKTTFLYW